MSSVGHSDKKRQQINQLIFGLEFTVPRKVEKLAQRNGILYKDMVL